MVRHPDGPLAILLKKHPLHDRIPGMSRNVLYSLPPEEHDAYVVHALMETANLRRDRRSDVLLAAHVGRQARDREIDWPITEVYREDLARLEDDAEMDKIHAEMLAIVRRLVKLSHDQRII